MRAPAQLMRTPAQMMRAPAQLKRARQRFSSMPKDDAQTQQSVNHWISDLYRHYWRKNPAAANTGQGPRGAQAGKQLLELARLAMQSGLPSH
jgi:hypothetical protein